MTLALLSRYLCEPPNIWIRLLSDTYTPLKKVLIISSNSYVATSCWGCIAFKKQLQLGREEGFIQRMTAPMQLCSTQTKYIYTHICYVTADRAAFDIPRRRQRSTTTLLLPTTPASGFLYGLLVAMYTVLGTLKASKCLKIACMTFSAENLGNAS